jgi:hypothetical protein
MTSTTNFLIEFEQMFAIVKIFNSLIVNRLLNHI